jgi:hypothetical protein
VILPQNGIKIIRDVLNLEVHTTDDRKGYVPMAHRLSRESDPDKVLDFVLRVLDS